MGSVRPVGKADRKVGVRLRITDTAVHFVFLFLSDTEACGRQKPRVYKNCTPAGPGFFLHTVCSPYRDCILAARGRQPVGASAGLNLFCVQNLYTGSASLVGASLVGASLWVPACGRQPVGASLWVLYFVVFCGHDHRM